MIKPWDKLSSEVVFEHRWYKLRRDTVRLPGGTIVDDYFVSVRPDVAMVFAQTPSDELLLVRQYKHGIGRITLELPAGTFDAEAPRTAAERELLEETGYRCSELRALGTLIDDATRNTSSVHMFLGRDAVAVAEQDLDDNERESGIEIVLVPRARVLEHIRSGEIASQASVSTIYRALDELQRASEP